MEVAVSGCGDLVGFTTVYQALTPERPPPFIVGNVRLDEGPFLTVLLKAEDESVLRVGTKVTATPVPREITEGATTVTITEWQFAPEQAP